MRDARFQLLLTLAAAAILASCTSQDAPGETRVYMMSRLNMVMEFSEDDGTAGLDLDGQSSRADDVARCAHDDHVSPEGVEGIDNQFARLGDVVRLFEFGDINSNLQQYVNEGGLAVLVEVSGINDPLNDSHVEVLMHTTNGPLEIGTDGVAEPGQSFDLVPDAPTMAGTGRIRDGVLTFELSGSLTLPLRFAMTFGDVRVQDVQGQLALESENGGVRGTLGGYVPAGDVEDIVQQALFDGGGVGDGMGGDGAGGSIFSLLGRVLRGNADAQFDDTLGICTALSGAIEVEGVPAFILGPEAP